MIKLDWLEILIIVSSATVIIGFIICFVLKKQIIKTRDAILDV